MKDKNTHVKHSKELKTVISMFNRNHVVDGCKINGPYIIILLFCHVFFGNNHH